MEMLIKVTGERTADGGSTHIEDGVDGLGLMVNIDETLRQELNTIATEALEKAYSLFGRDITVRVKLEVIQ